MHLANTTKFADPFNVIIYLQPVRHSIRSHVTLFDYMVSWMYLFYDVFPQWFIYICDDSIINPQFITERSKRSHRSQISGLVEAPLVPVHILS